MREEPPQQLVELLEELGLATAGQLRAVGRTVRRLARKLPLFESVWVDALAQARVLTPFQAAQINAGRGRSLRVGPHVLCEPVPSPGYAACYRAGQIESGRIVRLAVIQSPGDETPDLLRRLKMLVAASEPVRCEIVAPVTEAGQDGDRLWVACRYVDGLTAGQWMVHNGRLPPEAVLEIAHQMLPGLVALEKAGLCHGDLGPSGLILADGGRRVVLPHPGLRAAVRPREGYAHADLPPEAYDYLPPERITEGTPPTVIGDVYACGCLWWHLLTGRPPVVGGSALAKLQAAQTTDIPDVRTLAPDTPKPLAAAIAACVQRDPARRPGSLAQLAAMVGSPDRAGNLLLARSLAETARRHVRWGVSVSNRGRTTKSKRAPLRAAVAAACLLAAAATVWAIRHGRLPVAAISGDAPVSQQANTGNRSTRQPKNEAVPSHPTKADSAVLAAAEPSSAGKASRDAKVRTVSHERLPESDADVLLLAPGGSLVAQPLELRDGQRVCGPPGERPRLSVPRAGLVVEAEGVCFENIDFAWDDNPAGPETALPNAFVRLRASRAAFIGCTFRGPEANSKMPAAICWTFPANRENAELSLPSGRVELTDCVLEGVEAGVDCRTVGAIVVKVANSLLLESGPLVRLDHAPKPDEPTAIRLSEVTLRDTGPLMECHYQQIADQPGTITVWATGCVLVPRPDVALLMFVGEPSPERLLETIRWTGQGALVWSQTVIAGWRRAGDREQSLDDASISIAGLVRSEVQFAGPPGTDPDTSRVVRWQAPLRSNNPPGVDPERLARRNEDANLR